MMSATKMVRRAAGLALVLSALAGTALAAGTPVPEIDPGSILGAMTLLGGGLMMLTDRRRSKSV